MSAQAKPFYELVDRGRDATCFKCYGELVDLSASGYAHGNGGCQGFCEACRMVTYFDATEMMGGDENE